MAAPQPWADRGWVPPTVFHLLWLSIAVVLLLAGSLLLSIAEHGGLDIGGRLVEALPLEVGLLGLAILPLTLPLWLAAAVIISRSRLWTPREKFAAAWAPLWTALVLGALPGIALALGGRSAMNPALGLAIGIVLVGGGWVLVRTWKRGSAEAARRRSGATP